MAHLLLVSLGPVQDFIASARRCQDLWFGSWLLSELSRAVAVAIREKGGEDCLIFPGSTEVSGEPGAKPAVANKILVHLRDGLAPSDVAEAGLRALDAVRDRLVQNAFDKLPRKWFHRDIAERQVRDLIEYVWVAVPHATGTYADARDRAERALAARKNVRTWRQVLPADAPEPTGAADTRWATYVPKSSLDGWREAVLDEGLYDELQRREREGQPEVSVHELRERYFVRKNERLCGVGLLKRVGSEVDLAPSQASRPAFHSTSHVASAPVRTRIGALGAEAAVAGAIDRFVAKLRALGVQSLERLRVRRAGHVALAFQPGRPSERVEVPVALGTESLDGRLLYIEQLPALLDEMVPGHAERPARDRRKVERELAGIVRDLLRAIHLSADALPTYYAVLQADGDDMGRALDVLGKRCGVDGHRSLALALDAFSANCRSIVENHAGSLVYAGGDDVLALLPLHTAIACARRLRDDFVQRVRNVLGDLRIEPEAASPTLSVGLGIGHHLDDMADVRALAVAAEKKAKSLPGKDALAIVVQMRSGGRLELVDGWRSAPDRRLDDWARVLADGTISNKAPFDLQAALAPLTVGSTESTDAHAELRPVVESLAFAVLARKMEGATPELEAEIRGRVHEHFAARTSGSPLEAADALARELQLARVLGRAYQVAFPFKAQEAQ